MVDEVFGLMCFATDNKGMMANPTGTHKAAVKLLKDEVVHQHIKALFRKATEKWLQVSLAVGPLNLLQPKFLTYQQLLGKFWTFLDELNFAMVMKDVDRWTPDDVADVWPAGPTQQKIVAYLTRFSRFSSPRLRNAYTKFPNWTTSKYRNVQNWLRHGQQNLGFPLAAKMFYYFDNALYRAPNRPWPHITTLWRGIHGDMALAFQTTGQYTEKGFIACSYSQGVAESFAQQQILMRLSVVDVPPGTPWVWFGSPQQPTSTMPSEKEVLLPPGTLTAQTPNTSHDGGLPVRYTPSTVWPVPQPTLEEWAGMGPTGLPWVSQP